MMEPYQFQVDGTRYSADLNAPLDISIPLNAGEGNPNCYYTPPVQMDPILGDGFIGSVARGGSCNHQQITLAPHGNGTHTECFGHITEAAEDTINQCLRRFHFLGQLITLTPEIQSNGDAVITWDQVNPLVGRLIPEALIIRTLPNGTDKLTRQYSGTNPPYLEEALCGKLKDLGISHLLVDLPSVDREDDKGRLAAHKAFWNFEDNPRKECTITELIYVDHHISDGWYLLNLQIISLESDASPSKPVLYALI